jgi:4-diphosphocytidyl-2-C-methyl-D-erythritol kinase
MIDPAPALPAMGLVLINPNLPVSTAAVFSEFGGGFTSAGRFNAPIESAGRFNAPFEKAKDFATALSERHNDLMTPARNIEPEINTVLDALGGSEDCLLWRLSGSGATCFGLFETENTASKAASDIATSRPNWWVRSTYFLERAEVPVPMP